MEYRPSKGAIMKTQQYFQRTDLPPCGLRDAKRRGSALVVVLILLLLVTSFVLMNARVLYHLKQDLARLDKQQQQHQHQQAGAVKAETPVASK